MTQVVMKLARFLDPEQIILVAIKGCANRSNLKPEFLDWCQENLGEEGLRWEIVELGRAELDMRSYGAHSKFGDAIFEFTDDADAVLFKLRWT